MKKSNSLTLITIKIIAILVICFSLIAITYKVTLSWFLDESVTSNGEPNINVVGTVELNVTTNFNFYNLALAPDTIYTVDQDSNDIATYVSTSYKNDVREVYVRAKFSYTCDDPDCTGDELSLYFDNNLSSSDIYTEAMDNWVYNDEDGYYYYIGYVFEDKIMFNRGYKTNNTFYNIKANAPISIEFDFEAIQRPYGAYKALWKTAPKVFNDFALNDSGV